MGLAPIKPHFHSRFRTIRSAYVPLSVVPKRNDIAARESLATVGVLTERCAIRKLSTRIIDHSTTFADRVSSGQRDARQLSGAVTGA